MKVEINSANDFMDFVDSLSQKGNIYIVGAGKYGKIIGKFLTESEIPWNGYVDKNIKSPVVDEKKVYSYLDAFTEKDFFMISSFAFTDEMVKGLKQINISEDNIIVFSNIQDIIYDAYKLFSDYGEYVKKIQRFCNRYPGQRCFIIGNGPSLRISDLEKLTNEVTFACNSIYALYESTVWRPTFYCAWDPTFCSQVLSEKKEVQKLISNCEAAFTSIIGEGFQYRDDKDIENLFYVVSRHKINQDTGLPLFSDDCSKQTYTSGTVSYLMLQLAVYMGFSKIYLLGMDTSFSVERHKNGAIRLNKIENHQNDIEKEENRFSRDLIKKYGYSYIADIDMQIDGYRAAKKYADTHGIKIYNATRGGKLEVFERVDFDTLF